jgi:hypothetical protein
MAKKIPKMEHLLIDPYPNIRSPIRTILEIRGVSKFLEAMCKI